MKAALLAALALLATPALADEIQMAITVDDLPAHSALPPGMTRVQIAEGFLAALKDAKAAPVYGFINGVQNEREPDSAPVLELWRKAGHPLGNHTWSHQNLAQLDAAAFEAEVARNEPILRKLAGDTDWLWLRYPFLSEGDTPAKRDAARAILKARGYKIASVTMSFDDWAWNESYARCVAKNDQAAIADLETRYLAAAETSLDYSRALSKAVNGGDIPYVLLMHLGAFDTRMAPRLLALYRAKGVTLVSLEQAQAHPFYKADIEAAATPAPTTLENAARAKGLAMPPKAIDLAAVMNACR